MKLQINFARLRAFTLIELIITTALILIISLMVMNVLMRSFSAYRYNAEAVKMQDEAARALYDFESKSRGAEEVVTASETQFEFYAYIAGDVRPAPSKIRYFYDDGDLTRGIINPEGAGPVYAYPSESETFKTLSTGVLNQNLFSYYSDADYNYNDDSATKLAFPIDLTLIKMVRLSLEIDYNVSKPPVAANESSLVNLRNLKRNL